MNARAQHGVRRRADAQAFGVGRGHDREPVGDRGRQRLLGIDVLARFDRVERDLGVGFGDGEIEHDVDVVAPEQLLNASRLDRKALGLPLCGLRRSRSAQAVKPMSRKRGPFWR